MSSLTNPTGATTALTGPLLPTPDPLTTLADLKIFLSIPSGNTSQDALLQQMIVSASARLTQAMCRNFMLRSNPFNPLTEWYRGTGTNSLVLNVWPVRQVVSVYVSTMAFWGQGVTPTLLTPGSDYALVSDAPDGVSSMSGVLVNLRNTWYEVFLRDTGALSVFGQGGWGNIQVTYYAGYDSIPAEVAECCRLFVARMRHMRTYGAPVNAEHWEEYGYSIQYDTDQTWGILGGEMNSRLARYRIKQVAASF